MRKQSGFTLVEALVAFVVLAVSMLAFTRLQVSLRLNSDVSKQRSEAVRLAQERIDELRNFNAVDIGQLTTAQKTSTDEKTFASIATTAAQSITSAYYNTTYQRTITVSATSAPSMKTATVTVAWTDRVGTSQVVRLSTLISGQNPALAGQANIAPVAQSLRNPLNRNLRIPLNAVELGENKGKKVSGFTPPGQTGFYYVFSNTDATVFQICSLGTGVTLSQSEYQAQKDNTAVCKDAPGYFVSGSVSFDLSNSISLVEQGGKRPADPPTTVCDFYNNAVSKGIITAGTNPTLVALADLTGVPLYYALNVQAGTMTPANNANCVNPSTKWVLDLSTNSTVTDNLTGVEFVPVTGQKIEIKEGSNSRITWTPTVAASTLTGVAASGVSGTPGTATIAITSKTARTAQVVIDPGNVLANYDAKTYTITIPANMIKFTLGSGKNPPTDNNSIAISLIYTTQGAAPTISTFSPSNGGTLAFNALNSNLELKFNKKMAKGNGVIQLYRINPKNDKPILVETFSLPSSDRATIGNGSNADTLVLDPIADLAPGETYYVTIENGALKATDADGCGSFPGITESTTWKFQTGGSASSSSCPASPVKFMDMAIANLALTGGTLDSTNSKCYTDAQTVASDGITKYVTYFCVVQATSAADSAFKWSGNLKVQAPTNWSTHYKVCRYTDPTGKYTNSAGAYLSGYSDANMPPTEHPANYTAVGESLTDQNFLVVAASETCPSQELNVTQTLKIYFKTVQHQP